MNTKTEYIDTRIKYCESEKTKEILLSEIFDEMYDKRIFLIEAYKSRFYIREACDEYFEVELTKEMCQKLSKAFLELANCFEDTEPKEIEGE